MIQIYPYEELGRHNAGWLDARYHFSFADYHNPERMRFGALRVINDDIVKVGGGFAPHPHKDMEIVTYVRRSAISHRDSLGNEGVTAAGDVQVMSAGTGIQHAEFNAGKEDINLYQIWIYPRERGVKPRWDMRQFPKQPVNDALPLLVSGNETDSDKGALFIHADAAIYGGRMKAGVEITQPVTGQAYVLVSEGAVEIGSTTLKKGDGAEVTDVTALQIKAIQDAEIVMIDLTKP